MNLERCYQSKVASESSHLLLKNGQNLKNLVYIKKLRFFKRIRGSRLFARRRRRRSHLRRGGDSSR